VASYLGRYRFDRLDRDDAVQEFFTHILESGVFQRADEQKGSFRAYLLTSLRHFVSRQFETQSTQKRGQDFTHTGLDDASEIEERDNLSPENQFHREWATLVLRRAIDQLQSEAAAAGKLPLFNRVSPFLTEDAGREDYQRIGLELGIRPNTIAVAVFRLRERFRVLVRREVAETVDSEESLQDELARLREVLGH
jgi:RNA polymerase sigma-70 factor (ECF subfamily)